MITEGIDPRDVLWEDEQPAYRVYFWDPTGTRCDEWRLTEVADVHEVLAWAEERAGERSYVLYVEHDDSGRRGLIRLAGTDPTTGGGESRSITVYLPDS